MTRLTAGATAIRPIKPRLKKGVFPKMFGGKPFVHTLIELVKNARDYGATSIRILSQSRNTITIVDNGEGMGGENRDGFVSVNDTTAKTDRQAGRYGTGVKQMLYSHSSAVEVVTVSAEEPDVVYRFKLTTDSYEDIVLNEEALTPERLPKTATTWPHASTTGSQITYTFCDPSSKVILRGERLASELAARLPLKFLDIIVVDNQPLPTKKIVGKVFTHSEKHPVLGSVHVELYRPERRRADEDLRLAGTEVGEIPLRNVARVLGDTLQDMVPAVFRMDAVCGTITIPAFRQYANEDRHTVDARIADDRGIMPFIRFLQQIAPRVQKELDLRLEAADSEEVMTASVQEVKGLLVQAYGEGDEDDTDHPDDGTDTGGGDGDDDGGTGPEAPPVRLILTRHEFEPGEKISVRVKLNPAAALEYDVKQLRWHTQRSGCTVERQNDSDVLLVARDVGTHEISVEIPGTPYGCRESFEIVPERKFRLSLERARIEVGGQLLLTGINADKLEGGIVWTCGNRTGELRPRGAKATFHATRAGIELITAHAAKKPEVSATCRVSVTGEAMKRIRIRNHVFEIKGLVGNQQSRPVTIVPMSKVHSLHIARAGRGMQAAADRGNLTQFLTFAIALEYASFVKLKLEPEDAEDMGAGVLQEEISMVAYEVFEEILRKK